MASGRRRSGKRKELDLSLSRDRRSLSEDRVELAAAEIRHVVRSGTLDMALSLGEIVFRRIFDGDLELLRTKGPKHVSFRQLTERQDLGLSRGTLWRAVAVYELSLRVPALRTSQHIGVSHARAVLGLPTRQQERLLARAEREHLDVSVLEREAAEARKGHGGRPRKLEVLRAIDALLRVTHLPVEVFSDRRALAKLTAEDVAVTATMLSELDDRVRVLRALLREAGAKRLT